MNLKNFLQSPLQRLSKGALVTLFLLTAIGFADATYLTVEHYTNKIPPCSIGSCETVLSSQYASVLGLPVSLYGAAFYFAVLILLMIYLDSKKAWAIKLSALLVTIGAVISVVLIGIMSFALNAYCVYCLVSDTITIILCVAFWIVLRKYKTHEL